MKQVIQINEKYSSQKRRANNGFGNAACVICRRVVTAVVKPASAAEDSAILLQAQAISRDPARFRTFIVINPCDAFKCVWTRIPVLIRLPNVQPKSPMSVKFKIFSNRKSAFPDFLSSFSFFIFVQFLKFHLVLQFRLCILLKNAMENISLMWKNTISLLRSVALTTPVVNKKLHLTS